MKDLVLERVVVSESEWDTGGDGERAVGLFVLDVDAGSEIDIDGLKLEVDETAMLPVAERRSEVESIGDCDDVCSSVTVSEAAIDELSVCVSDCVRDRCILEDDNDDVSV